VVAHRLVEVHAVEDWGVESGEQLLGDDQDLGQLFGIAERLPDLLLLVLRQVVLRQLRRIVVRRAVYDRRVLGREVAVQGFLVQGAPLAVGSHDERLVTGRFDLRLEVVGDERSDVSLVLDRLESE